MTTLINNSPKCPECFYSFQKKNYKNELWYNCSQCGANLVSVSSLKEILSDYEFTRLNSEIINSKVLSSKNCPCCNGRMIKILDLVRVNEVEVCTGCQLVWLDPKEGAKLKFDQINESSTARKIDLNLNSKIDISYSSMGDDQYGYMSSPFYFAFREFYKFILKITLVEEISKNYPVLGFLWFVIVVLFCGVIFFYFSRLFYVFTLARMVMN